MVSAPAFIWRNCGTMDSGKPTLAHKGEYTKQYKISEMSQSWYTHKEEEEEEENED